MNGICISSGQSASSNNSFASQYQAATTQNPYQGFMQGLQQVFGGNSGAGVTTTPSASFQVSSSDVLQQLASAWGSANPSTILSEKYEVSSQHIDPENLFPAFVFAAFVACSTLLAVVVVGRRVVQKQQRVSDSAALLLVSSREEELGLAAE